MPIKDYKRSFYCQAIQFTSTDSAHVQEIIDFVGLPISIDYTADAGVRLRVIRGAFDVLVAYTTDYIVKHQGGRLEALKKEQFESEYEEVSAGSG
jgi:hypothetical protein